MSTEPWVLAAIRDLALANLLRKCIAQSGFRTTQADSLDECRSLLDRRVFLSIFVDLPFLNQLSKNCPFSSSTYVTLLVHPTEVPKALQLQRAGKIHDWLTSPPDLASVSSALSKAKTFLRIAGELESIRSATATAIQNDASVIYTGKWADSANRWLDGVRNSEFPLLLAGEPGTGKRLLARLLHFSSKRAGAPFVLVRCNGTDLKDLEREIFGEIPPRDRPPRGIPLRSKFSLAANGTILFDKADQLPASLQQRIAKTIETRRFSPIGGGDTVGLDARLIFTVQENRKDEHPSKQLHRDLAQALKRWTLRIPPLREREADLPLIAKSVMEKLHRDNGVRAPGITDKALDALRTQAWPGNVRELEGILWAASILANRNKIGVRHLTPFVTNGHSGKQDEELAIEELMEDRLQALFRRFGVNHLNELHPMIMNRVEKPLLKLVLQQTQGNQIRAASLLGINRNTLRRKLVQYELI